MFGYRRGAPLYTLLLLSCMSFLLYVDRVNLSTAAGPISKDLGLTNTQLGIAFSAFGYSYAMFQVAGGWIADRVGARLTLLACGIVWVATTVGTGFVGGFAALLVVRFVLGIGEGATLPAAARALTNWTPPARRGFAQGITHSASRLGNAVAPPVVAALTLAYSWRTSFFVLGAITAVWVAIWWWYFRDDPRRHPAMRPDDLAGLPPFRAADAGRGPVPWLRLLRRTAPTMIVYFCYGWTAWLFFTWLPTFFLQGYGLDLRSSALFSSAVFFAGVVGDATGGILSDRILARTGDVEAARRNVILISLGGAAVFLVPVFLTHDLVLVSLSLGCAFFMLELTVAPIWAVPMDVAPDHAGVASGFVNAAAAVAGIVSPTVFGLLVDRTGSWTLPFAGSMVLLVVGGAAAFFMKPQNQVDAGS